MKTVLEDMLTGAQVTARLNLEIRQFQSALPRGLIPPPRLVAGKWRWTQGQVRAVMGEATIIAPADAEAEVLRVIEGRASRQ